MGQLIQRIEGARHRIGARAAASARRRHGDGHLRVRRYRSRDEPEYGQQFQPGQPLLRRPQHSGSVRAAYTQGRATLNFNLRMIGRRFDSSFLSLRTVPNSERPTADTTDITINPGYVVAGLGLDLRVHEAFTVFLRGDNIGDTVYESALDIPASRGPW